MKTKWLTLTVLVIASGCATKPDISIEAGSSLTKFTQVEIAQAVNETGNSANDSVALTFGSDLREAFRSEGVTVTDSSQPEGTLLVKPSLIHYEAGSAIARWILPGMGRTQASVSALLLDKATGKSLGDVAASDQVAAGGLYTIGQDRLILSRLANGFAKDIAARMQGQ